MAYKDPEKGRRDKRRWSLKKLYGITPEDYDQMYESQDGLCALCHKPANGRLDIDHDHETGEVRALLHRGCNIRLGLLEDAVWHRLALTYLARFKPEVHDRP